MAGQQLTAEQIAAAGKNNGSEGAGQQNTGASQQQQQAAPGKKEEFIVSQEQFNLRWAEKMAALEKELGVPIKDAKTLIAEHNAKLEGEKSEMQKLQEGLNAKDQELAGYKLKSTIYDALLEAGVQSKQIPKLALRVNGETAEEIQTDIADLKKDFPAMFAGTGGSPGGGHPGVQDTPGAPRVYKASEIRSMSHQERIANEKDILRAMATPGGIIQD
jgi:hypothetical protein